MDASNRVPRVSIRDDEATAIASSLKHRLAHRGLAVAISGADGTGKSTLMNQIAQLFEARKIPVRCEHRYTWYENITWVPVLVVWNRFVSRKVLLLDRCIFDNLAKFFQAPDRALALATAVAQGALPRFDLRIHLTATAAELLSRRSENTFEDVDRLVRNYRWINSRTKAVIVPSDEKTLGTTLQHILRALRR